MSLEEDFGGEGQLTMGTQEDLRRTGYGALCILEESFKLYSERNFAYSL